jgi:hypothetical protein
MLRHRWSWALFRLGMGFGLVLAAAGCATAPPPASSVAAADPAVQVPPIQYRSVTLTSVMLAPAEPEPWQDVNRNVAPPARPRGQEP